MELRNWKICPLKNGKIVLVGSVYGDKRGYFFDGQKVKIEDVKTLSIKKLRAKTIYGDFDLVNNARNEREK